MDMMKNRMEPAKIALVRLSGAVCVALVLLVLAACSKNDRDNAAPVAEAGPDVSARLGSEIVLSGRDSFDPDGPVMQHQWRQVAGPEAQVFVVNNSSVRVKIPQLDEETDLIYELTVSDNLGATGSDRVTVHAKAPNDSNRFLTYFTTPSGFVIEAALTDGNATLTAPVQFNAVLQTFITYTDLGGETKTVAQAVQTRPGSWTPEAQAEGLDSRIEFDVPAVDFFALLDANPALRNAATVDIQITLEQLSEPVAYRLSLLDSAGERIDIQQLAASGLVGLPGAVSRVLSSADLAAAADSPDTLSLSYENLLKGISSGQVENQQTAEAYYRAIDPDNRKTNLSDWLKENGFLENNDVVEARYINGFDLGFGRYMRLRVTEEGYVYASVSNYPNMDSMIAGTNLIANVSMEYSPGPEGGEPYTKFYTFTRNPETGSLDRVLSMDFDGRGEKFTPGNCAVCHGGRPVALDQEGNYPDGGNIGSRFMLWDVDTFAFSDAEYEGRKSLTPSPYHRADQEAAFKFFNMAILQTNLSDAQRDLIQGWYGGEGLPSAKFNGSYVPQGWRKVDNGGPLTNPDIAEELYTEVVGPTCRGCHLNLDVATFATYENFSTNHAGILRYVYDEGVMPMARVTMDNFWVERFGGQSRADKLADYLSAMKPDQAFVLGERMPGRPLAKIAFRNSSGAEVSQGGTGLPLLLDGTSSLFADSYQWQLSVARDEGLPLVLEGNPIVVDDTRPIAQLKPDLPGTYAVSLRVAAADRSSEATAMFTVPDLEPFARSSDLATGRDGNPLLEDADEFRFSVLSNDELGNLPVVLTIDAQGALGVATVADNGTPLDSTDDYVVYRPTDSVVAAQDQFTYSLTDVDGDTSSAVVRFNLNQSADGPSRPAISSIAAGKPSPQVALAWTASSAPQGSTLAEYRLQRRLSENGESNPGNQFTEIGVVGSNTTAYTDNSGEAGKTYDYRVKAVTGQGGFSISEIASVTTLSLPTTPSGVSAQILAGRLRVLVSWLASTYSEGAVAAYRIEKKLGAEPESAWAILDEVLHTAAASYEYVDNDLSLATQYVYRLTAVGDDTAESAPTAALGVTTGDANAPNSLPGLPVWSATAVENTATVAFSITVPVDSDGTVEAIAIERTMAGQDSYAEITSLRPAGAAGAELTYLDVTGLPNTGLEYRLIVEDDEGGRTTSSALSVTTGNTPPLQPDITSSVDITGPAPVARLTWPLIADPETENEASYEISRQPLAGFSDEPDETAWTSLVVNNSSIMLTIGANPTILTDSTLTASNYHIYRIVAVDADGGRSVPGVERVQNTNEAPEPVTDLVATPSAGAKSVSLSWTQPQDDGNVVKAKIYRIKNADCLLDNELVGNRLLATINTAQAPGQSISYEDTTLLCSGAVYQYFVVVADNLDVDSASSNVASFGAGQTTYNAAPGQPVLGVTRINEISPLDYQIQLTVTGGEDADADDTVQYEVYRNGSLIDTVARVGSPATFTDATVVESTDNSYYVVATDGLADSTASATVKEPPLISNYTSVKELNTAVANVHELDLSTTVIPEILNLKDNSTELLYDELQVFSSPTSPTFGARSSAACNETMPSSKASDKYSVSKLCVGDSEFKFRLRYGSSYWTPYVTVSINLRTANSIAGLTTPMNRVCSTCHLSTGLSFTDKTAREFLQTHDGTSYPDTFVTSPTTRNAMYDFDPLVPVGAPPIPKITQPERDLFEAWISHGQHCKSNQHACD